MDPIPLDAALERVADKLRQARERDARPFGAESRGLPPALPPLTPEAVAAAEARLGVALPEEYRGFVLRIGDGGAGPAYGLFALETALRVSEADGVPELLRTPFPHGEHYNPDTDPAVVAFWNRADAGGVSEAEEDVHVAMQRRGALVLCDEGCGYLHFLVVSGPARGTMWIDARGGDQGFIPLEVTFLEWYERWLDDVLAGGRGTWWLADPVLPAV